MHMQKPFSYCTENLHPWKYPAIWIFQAVHSHSHIDIRLWRHWKGDPHFVIGRINICVVAGHVYHNVQSNREIIFIADEAIPVHNQCQNQGVALKLKQGQGIPHCMYKPTISWTWLARNRSWRGHITPPVSLRTQSNRVFSWPYKDIHNIATSKSCCISYSYEHTFGDKIICGKIGSGKSEIESRTFRASSPPKLV